MDNVFGRFPSTGRNCAFFNGFTKTSMQLEGNRNRKILRLIEKLQKTLQIKHRKSKRRENNVVKLTLDLIKKSEP